MQRRHLWLLVGVFIAAAGLMTTTAATAGPQTSEIRKGGTARFGADQEPGSLNPFIVGGDHLWTAAAHYLTMAGTFRITPKLVYTPDIARLAVVRSRPLTLRYTIKPQARWNDGRPITAQDYVFTYRTIMNKEFNILSITGYEDIRSIRAQGRKRVTVVFKKPYAGFRDLFGQILPRHALSGRDFDEVWRSNINNPKTDRPIASGPFQFGSWDRGSQMTFNRNAKYWGKKANLSRIVFRFVPNTQTQAQQIRGGELDVINPQPQAYLTPLRKVRSLKVQSSQGLAFEHLDFNVGHKGGGHKALRKRFVRQAIGYGINRSAITNALYRKIVGRLPVLNSVIFLTNSPLYRPHWARYKFNQQKAINLLRANGCKGGPSRPGGGGTYSCPGVGELSFRFTSTAGNQLREQTFLVIQQQLKRVGIEVISRFGSAATVFRNWKVNGDYDIIMFAWLLSTPDASGWDSVYGCRTAVEAQQNDQGYCNRTVDRLLKRANTQFDNRQQARTINRALAIMAKDNITYPLFQKPTFLVHKRKLVGITDNPLSAGPLWRTETWAFAS